MPSSDCFSQRTGSSSAGNHRGGVDTTEGRRQSRECALEEQTRSRAAFSHYRVDEALLEFFDHHVDRDVTLQLISSVIHRSGRLRRERRSRQHRSDRAEQTAEKNDRARRAEKCDGDKEVNTGDLRSNHDLVACDCHYTRAHLLLLHACRLAQSLLRNLREHHDARMTRGVWGSSQMHCKIQCAARLAKWQSRVCK